MSLKRIIKKALTISTLSLITTLSFNANAQTGSEKDREALRELMKEKPNSEIDKRRIATQFDFGQIELSLAQKKYDTFFDVITQVRADETLTKFLEAKIHDGHIPVYWVLADINARHKTGLDAHKWLYIATIMTEQDIVLCGDKSIEGYTKKILRSFPDTIYYTRATPYYIQDAMKRTYDFISGIKERQPPNWICSMRVETKNMRRAKPIHRSKWESTRSRILEDYAGKYKPKITSQDIFKELEEKERMDKSLEAIEMKNKKQ